MPDPPRNLVHIRCGSLTAEIDPQGAQLFTLKDRAGRDLLWDGDPAVWAGRAPILFPIVGALADGRYRLGSNSYPLSRHGFARGKMFSIGSTSSSSAVFQLSADEATLAVYPFRFELEIQFELVGATLSLTARIRNRGDIGMPASVGFHPAFRWPLPFGQPRSSHSIRFATDEPAPVRRLDSAGLLTPARQPTPVVNRRLALTDALFQDDVMIFDEIRSRSVIYGADEGPRIQVSFPDARYLGLWTKPGGHFICIEPWHGIADPEGFSGDFKQKPGVFIVAPGDVFATMMTIALVEPREPV